MTKSNHEEDLDLLLSLQDRVLETPTSSPAASPRAGYLSDDELPKRRGKVDMSVFREAVGDCIDYDLKDAHKALKSKSFNSSNQTPEIEKFSGLKIRNQVVSSVELSNSFSDIRFIRLPAIKNLLNGDSLSGCWATVGVLIDKGIPRNSSTGKPYSIWKMSCLDDMTLTVFLFGDAYQKHRNDKAGTVFGLFNCGVRKDNSENGFSLSVYSACNILKIGTSADYGVCRGKRKDGVECNVVVNKRRGIYCKYHKQKSSEKYSFTRAEYKGGNLKTAFRDHLKSEGIYVVEPLADKVASKSKAPLKLLSVDALKAALSNAGKTTTNMYSQGIRFLTEVTEKPDQVQSKTNSFKRSSLVTKKEPDRERPGKESGAKKIKVECQIPLKEGTESGKMIELEVVSSDEE